MTAPTSLVVKHVPPILPLLPRRVHGVKLTVSGWLLVAWTKPLRKGKVAL